jgi:5-methyltetrahydrofolate--homocysteine methyltransferase
VLDASRAVGVAGQLKSPELREALAAQNRDAQERLRAEHRAKRDQPLRSLEEARRRKPKLDWKGYAPPRPAFTGVRAFDPWPLADIVPFIDWSPFFAAWEMTGTYPRIFDNPTRGAEARRLFDDAQRLLDRIVREELLTARAVFGFFPANAVGDDVELYTDDSRTGLLTTLHTLRQQSERPDDQPHQALADYVAPRESGVADYVGAFAVTAGIGIESVLDEFERDHDDYSAIMTKALADRLAEGLAEALHKRAREEWGYGRDENLSTDELIRERYRGIRPAPGYPACPDHTEKRLLFNLLDAERRAGIRLTETFAMLPAASVSGFYFSHPQARYFTVGRLDRDQVLDYARRKGLPLADVERWLGPNLNYEPDEKAATEAPAPSVVAERV